MLESDKSNKKNLEDFEELCKQAEITRLMEEDIMEIKDSELIEKIKETYNIEDTDFKVMSMPQYIFAKRFRTLIHDFGINGKNVKDILGITSATLSRYINGREYPSIDTIFKLAKALKVSSYYLLGLSKYTTLEADTINELLGLSEDSMKILFMLQHDTGECEELTDDVPISNRHKAKLKIFNSFIEDNTNFLKFLTTLEFYATLKKETKKSNNNNKEDIKKQLLRHKRRSNKYVA